MSLIENFKNYVGRIFLKKSGPIKSSQRGIPTFDSVTEIGIIYHAGSAANEEQINRVVHYLRDQGKKVWTMGFVNANTLPNNKKFHISSEYFWKEKLTWYNLPDTSKIGNFVTHRFDLLLNLYFEGDLPLLAMSSYTQSAYSMGANLPDALRYNDTIIDTGSEHSIQNLASQMVHYLKVINQK
jgi:hypothetical protein